MANQPPMLVILAGGSNSRFWPLTEKSLLPIFDLPLIEHQLRTLVDIGFRQIVVVSNPHNQESIQRVGNKLGDAVDFRVTVQQNARGMGDALLTLRPLAAQAPSPAPVYVCQVHDVFDPALHERMLQAFSRERDTAFVASYRVKSYFPGGYLVVDDDLRVTNLIEKPPAGREPSDLVSIVAHIHPDLGMLLDQIEAEYAKGIESDDHYERAMVDLMERQQFRAIPYSGPWFPVKYPWHVLDVMGYYLDRSDGQISEDADIAGTARLSGAVTVSAGARILDYATIVGPAYIGPNALVGQYANVRESMVGAGSVVGTGCEINRSYIGRGAAMHAARVLDSVVAGSTSDDEHVNLSAGVITANLRADAGHVRSTVRNERVDTGRSKFGAILGAGAFIGIGAMLMPGVKIGRGAIVGPATLVRADVADRTLFYAEQHYITRPLSGPTSDRP